MRSHAAALASTPIQSPSDSNFNRMKQGDVSVLAAYNPVEFSTVLSEMRISVIHQPVASTSAVPVTSLAQRVKKPSAHPRSSEYYRSSTILLAVCCLLPRFPRPGTSDFRLHDSGTIQPTCPRLQFNGTNTCTCSILCIWWSKVGEGGTYISCGSCAVNRCLDHE